MALQLPQAFIYMKVGPHGGETLDEILERKARELETAGRIFWSYGGNILYPETQVQPFAQEWTQKQGSVYVLMERLNQDGYGSGPRAGTATCYSVTHDGERKTIPEGIRTGPPHALILGEITRVDWKLDLRDFEVGVGPSKCKNAADYIGNRVDKGCLVAASSTPDRVSKPVHIGYQALLLSPYAVFLFPRDKNTAG